MAWVLWYAATLRPLLWPVELLSNGAAAILPAAELLSAHNARVGASWLALLLAMAFCAAASLARLLGSRMT